MADIIIQVPRTGVSLSPHVGYSECVNLDIDSMPGIVRLNNILVLKSSTVTDQINWLVRHPITTTEIYALGNTGKVYKSADSGATWAVLAGSSSTNAHGNGMMIWKNYLLVARDAFIDYCGDGTATGIITANWNVAGWQAIDSDVLWHPMLTSKNDNKIYGGAGRFVFSLDENTGQTFAPGTPATYTFTAQALDLPPSYRIKCIEGLGNNLTLGTWQGTNIYDIRIADIFPWDRSSSSFGQPTVIDDFGIHTLKNIGNSLIVLAGISGTVRKSDGSNAYIIGQIPTDISGGKYIEFYPGAICHYKNKIFFGTGNGGTTVLAGQGIYSLNQTGQGNILNLEHLNSSLTNGSTASVKISALLPVTRDTLLAGWSFYNTMTMTIADPCVVTLASHGFIDGTPILFTTTGALPTGITASTYYFIRSTGTNTFNLYDTAAHAIAGGATGRVITTGTQSGVHTGASYGIDLTNSASYAYGTDYSGYFVSPLYTTGNNQHPRKFSEIEFSLARPLRTSEGIKLEYRLNLTADFTTIKTFAYADVNVGAVISKNLITEVPHDIKEAEQVQFRVSITGSSTTTPEVKYIIVR